MNSPARWYQTLSAVKSFHSMSAVPEQAEEVAREGEALQKELLSKNRVSIPVLYAEDIASNSASMTRLFSAGRFTATRMNRSLNRELMESKLRTKTLRCRHKSDIPSGGAIADDWR
jgi:hypothetical protein